MSINLPLDFNRLKTLVGQCSIHEKLELIRVLEKDIFPTRFRQIRNNMKTGNLSMEEITKEVETVRAKRYNDKHDD